LRAAQSAGYLSYSEADFEVFRPAGATRWTDGVKFGTEVPSPVPNFTPIGAMVGVLKFDQNVEYKRPAGAHPLRDFHTVGRVCTTFQAALAVKISFYLLKGL